MWVRGGLHSRRLFFQTLSDGCGSEQAIQSYVREAYENFMIGNPENRKVRREDIVQWIQPGWEN